MKSPKTSKISCLEGSNDRASRENIAKRNDDIPLAYD